jgi:4-alpha-glucanotransferase
MRFPRSSGILLHPTSLPGPHGIGDLGDAAYRFVDFLADTGQRVWQVLPLGPTGYGDSPYQCFSAFAGNPLLISLERLVEEGWLRTAALTSMPAFPEDNVDFGPVIEARIPLLERAYLRFWEQADDQARAAFEAFCHEQSEWLHDYALYRAVKDAHDGATWTQWEPGIAAHEPDAVSAWSERLHDQTQATKFAQYQFFKQWWALKAYCNERGIALLGDIPIYVAHDSADVWANRELFHLDDHGDPAVIAGVPPDYFSATGQRWGNPLYRWDYLAETGYAWWIKRMQSTLSTVDRVRLDHFRGFEAYWEVPAHEDTAVNGQWVTGPGGALFEALRNALGVLPIVAEDLGVITDEVRALRDDFEFPGMAVLQFAFGDKADHPFLPHNYMPNVVAYTGTHDNETMKGWWQARARAKDGRKQERVFAERFLGRGAGVHWRAIQWLMASVADTAIFPMQDILGTGNEGRMNTPGNPSDNWTWRYPESALTTKMREDLRELTEIYGRAPVSEA